ncbi:leukemia inhibitory factor receptor isoform X1 [Tachysurus vachellii]|uniref:leukemia inhibitory factor receptor isoform X1 n=1 Tax=Tachysurus vachellii TaxID=175792 RepID=UPI00296A92EB|nr:leukemia inhibitory factor receptor isoform X1 [Tachysurus vachellii]
MTTRAHEVGLLVLVVAVFVDKVATCSISNPQCYKNTTRPDDDFLCEWKDQDHSPDAIYTIFMQTSSVNDISYSTKFDAGKNLFKILPVEGLITARLLDIWVHRQVFNVTCSSPTISVFLNSSVKYSPPNIQKKIRSAEKLVLSWPRVNDNKGAIHEIRWKKIPIMMIKDEDNDSWQNKSFKTEDGANNGNLDSYTLQLQKHTVYQVQIRRKAKQSLLWSHWSQTVDIPIEIQQPVVQWNETTHGGKREITINWTIPPPEASFGGVSYNLTLNLPCEKTKMYTIWNNTFETVATYSEARVSLVAINNIGSSPSQELVIPPVEHLKFCHSDTHKDSLPKRKRYCLEWYKLEDGETRPAKVNISRSNTLEDIKKDMEKFVRYYYFLHTGRNQSRRTNISCPVYSKEGVPSSQPKNVTVLNITHDSAVLWWQSIPVQEQRGFLKHYVIRISREGHNETGHHEVTANKTSFLLRNLEPGSSYTLNIAGRTEIGEGPNSTRTFFTLSSSSTDNGMKMAKIILTVCAVVLLFSIALSVAIRRLRRKLLPIIPSPVISPAAMPCMDKKNMKPMTEKVDDVILLPRDQDIHRRFPRQKHTTSLPDFEVSLPDEDKEDEEDEDEDEDDDAESHFTGLISSAITSSFPNPNYKGQLLQFTEALEIADKGQMESCEVNTPSYKNGLFFENRTVENEEISVQS